MTRIPLLLATAACLVLAACSKPAETPGAAAQPPAGAANAPQSERPAAPKDLPVGAQVPGQAPTVVKLSDGTMVDIAKLKPMPGAKPVENPVVLKAPSPESTRSLGEPESDKAPAKSAKPSKDAKDAKGAAAAAAERKASADGAR